MFRIGYGIDYHQLQTGRQFWLGGIQIPHYKGAVGHSDADVLIHAICDAMLGAVAAGDIGTHFPDTDMAYKNIDSKILLKKCNGRMLIHISRAHFNQSDDYRKVRIRWT